MSLILPFNIGLLNLWICTVLLWSLGILASSIFSGGLKRAVTLPEMSAREKAVYSIWLGLQFLLYGYSIFVPFACKSIWFYPGLIIYILGLAMNLRGGYDYRTTPQDKLVTKGIFQISRNPDYFTAFLAYIGMGLLGGAWPILMLALVHFLLYQITVKYEERMCAKLWPDEFPEYKRKVAKNFLFF